MIAIGFICLFSALLLIISIGFKSNSVFCAYLALAIFILTAFGTLTLRINRNPSAMDVYKGRTLLQVTYQDSTAIDSVVVYKK